MKPYILGLTGSIGMGKSTTAEMFAQQGVPIWDADAAVRRLYAKGGAAAKQIAKHYPQVMEDDAVSRAKLRDLIAQEAEILDHIQTIVHPLVAQDRLTFLDDASDPVVVLDIPLLFETGGDATCDGVVVVTAPAEVQRQRVLDRKEMTEDEFDMILSRQMPDAEKRRRATWVIETLTLDDARAAVRDILQEINQSLPDA